MKVLVAHPGTQHAPQLARVLHDRDMLSEYWTGLAFAQDGLPAKIAAQSHRWPGLAGLGSRIVSGIPSDRLHTMPCVELAALWRLRAGHDSHLVLHERNRKFQENIPAAALSRNDAVIGFDTSAWILADRTQRLDQPLYLDRSIAHPAAFARIMAGLNRQYPDWAVSVAARPAVVAEAESREHALAHRIVVGCRFARDTLLQEGVPAEKVCVNPYGVDWSAFARPAEPHRVTRPFRFLYVGSVQARKGIPVLLEAWRRLALKDTELWIAGSIGSRERRLIPDLPGLRLLGQVPRAQMPGLYSQADVFVLPSLFEGFGLVLLEALAAGLPIIATPHTGAVELLDDAVLGELAAAGSVDELTAAMQRWRGEPGIYRARVIAAHERLAARFSWAAYGDRWAEILEKNS